MIAEQIPPRQAVVIDPRMRMLLLAIRQALYIVADALGDYCGQPRKAVQ